MKKDLRDFWKDGGVGRYTLSPHTTKRRTTTNLKTKNNQNCQKIELYGNPTTKELKQKRSFRLVGGAETGSPVVRMYSKVAAGGTVVPHLCVDKAGGTTGERDKPRNPRFQRREIKP